MTSRCVPCGIQLALSERRASEAGSTAYIEEQSLSDPIQSRRSATPASSTELRYGFIWCASLTVMRRMITERSGAAGASSRPSGRPKFATIG